MRRIIVPFILPLLFLMVKEANAAVFTFNWTGTVEEISYDGGPITATVEGIGVGDWFAAIVTYDTDDFGVGTITSPPLDYRRYPAPAGLQMAYYFQSGAIINRNITFVGAGIGGYFHQWNWIGDAYELLFQANDYTGSAFDPVVPESFDDIHTQFLGSLSSFQPSTGNHLRFPADDLSYNYRIVLFSDQVISVASNDILVILSFFDSAVTDGTLEGAGPGNAALNRMNAFRNMLVTAGELITDGFYEEACEQLYDAYSRCDGLGVPDSPPDFITGDSRPELAGLILALIADLS